MTMEEALRDIQAAYTQAGGVCTVSTNTDPMTVTGFYYRKKARIWLTFQFPADEAAASAVADDIRRIVTLNGLNWGRRSAQSVTMVRRARSDVGGNPVYIDPSLPDGKLVKAFAMKEE